MPHEIVEQTVTKATEQAYWDWARLHPSLAAVIDQMSVTARTAERLRETPEYHQAIAAYHRSRNELDLFNRILTLAGPLVESLLQF